MKLTLMYTNHDTNQIDSIQIPAVKNNVNVVELEEVADKYAAAKLSGDVSFMGAMMVSPTGYPTWYEPPLEITNKRDIWK